MDPGEALATSFEAARPRLLSVAHRMLGSATEAEDAVQETWLRLGRTDAAAVQNLTAWLTTVVGRICLDMLRARTARREDPPPEAEPRHVEAGARDPEQEAVLADSVGLALLVVLDTLGPAERLAFVLHDLFGVPFEEIAPIVGRSPAAARQLASRGRRRVQGQNSAPQADPAQRRAVVEAFLAAARNGEFAALVELLDPDVVLRGDAAAVALGGTGQLLGAEAVAGFYSGRAGAARPAVVGGSAGAVVVFGGQIRLALRFSMAGGRITAIEAIAEPDDLRGLDLILDVQE